MNKVTYNQERLFFIRVKNNMIFISLIFLYCMYLFVLNIDRNIYELYHELTNFLTFSYIIFPLYLLFIISFFSLDSIRNHMFFRFRSKQHWYHKNIASIALLVTSFIFLWLGILFFLSVFVVDFIPVWSDSFLKQNYVSADLLLEISPIAYTLTNLILLWLILFLFGLIFYTLLILSKSKYISICGVLLIELINIVITLGKINILLGYSFTTYMNPLSYMINKQTNQMYAFPFEIFLYWILWIICIYAVGRFMVAKVDFDFK